MTTPEVASAAMTVVVPIVAPAGNDEGPPPCLYLTTLMGLFTQDQSPAQALCSLLAMCWFWPSSCQGEEKDLFLGSALLSLGRLLKDKLACLAQDVTTCLPCQGDTKGDKRPVTIGCLILCGFTVELLQDFTQVLCVG